jgi:hypothetical protein
MSVVGVHPSEAAAGCELIKIVINDAVTKYP